jgi:hypothetical protein
MKPFVWPLIAVLAGLALGCSDEYALYRSPKYVPGYKPPGDDSSVIAHSPPRDRDAAWRERQL